MLRRAINSRLANALKMTIRLTSIPPFALFTLLFMLTSCGDDDFSLEGTNLSMTDIARDWTATKAVFSNAATGPAMRVDVVEDGGSVTRQIQDNGNFSTTVTPVGELPETSSGRMGFDEDLLIISFDDEPDEFEFFGITHNEPNMTIQDGTIFEGFDFDKDGLNEDVNIEFELVRN